MAVLVGIYFLYCARARPQTYSTHGFVCAVFSGLHLFSFVVSQPYNLNLSSAVFLTTAHSNIYKWRVTWHNFGCSLCAIRQHSPAEPICFES